MIGISLVIVVATAVAFWGNQLPDTYWYSLIPLLLIVSIAQSRYRLLFIFAAMFLWTCLQVQLQLDRRLADEADGQIYQLSGRIADITEQRKHAIRFLVAPDTIRDYSRVLPEKIRLSWYRSKQLPKAGESWQFTVKLRQPTGFQNPGAFDYERWLFVKGIGATGYVKKSSFNQRLAKAPWWDINRYRLKISEAIQKHCLDCRHLGLFKALTIGYRGAIDPAQRQLLQDTATAHLLAISGLHIGLVASLFYLLGRRLWSIWFYRLRFNRLEFSASLGVVAAIFYSALAGFSIPTVRALVMLAVVFAALLLRRSINLLNSLAVAVALILVVDPLAIGSTSFWLSVSALLIIALGQFLLANENSRLKQMLILQLLFSLMFIPISLLLFGQASATGFVANIVAIPLVSLLILPLVLVSATVAVFALPGANWLFNLADSLTSWLLNYLQALLQFGPDVYQGSKIPLLLLICGGTGLLFMLLPANHSMRRPALLLLMMPLFWRAEKLEQGSYRLSVLDVGMGTSVVVETRHHSLIYDFGPGNNSGFSAGDWVVKPYLRYRGIGKVDLMVVSHVDQDHSGGFISFLDQTEFSRLLSGTPAALVERFNLQASVRSCHDSPGWQWDGVAFEFLSVDLTGLDVSTNSRSCVLLIKGRHTALLSGDIEADQENRLLIGMPEKLDADFLLVPHHGSLTSSTEAFVRQVSPDIVMFTMGKDNRWGFPKADVVRRFQKQGSHILRSDLHGAVTMSSNHKAIDIESYRESNQRIWQ